MRLMMAMEIRKRLNYYDKQVNGLINLFDLLRPDHERGGAQNYSTGSAH